MLDLMKRLFILRNIFLDLPCDKSQLKFITEIKKNRLKVKLKYLDSKQKTFIKSQKKLYMHEAILSFF